MEPTTDPPPPRLSRQGRDMMTIFTMDDAKDLDKKSIMEARGYVWDDAAGKWR